MTQLLSKSGSVRFRKESMKIKNLGLVAFTGLCLFLPNKAFALDATSRLGAEVKALQTPAGMGILFGWRYLFHTSPYFSVGGAGYTGQISGTSTASYSYGGMIGAFHILLSPSTSMEVTVLGGGGGGKLDTGVFFGGTVVEPGLGFSFKLGKAAQFVAGASYVWMPGSAQGTGFSGGVKFEFLTDHRPEPTVSREFKPTATGPETPAGGAQSAAPVVPSRTTSARN